MDDSTQMPAVDDGLLGRMGAMLSPQTLERASDDRKTFLEGIAHLRDGDVTQATASFRRAQRRGEAPFTYLASVALGECLRLDGKEGAALRAWRSVGEDEDAPDVARYLAWLSTANLYKERNEEAGLVEAAIKLEAFEDAVSGSH